MTPVHDVTLVPASTGAIRNGPPKKTQIKTHLTALSHSTQRPEMFIHNLRIEKKKKKSRKRRGDTVGTAFDSKWLGKHWWSSYTIPTYQGLTFFFLFLTRLRKREKKRFLPVSVCPSVFQWRVCVCLEKRPALSFDSEKEEEEEEKRERDGFKEPQPLSLFFLFKGVFKSSLFGNVVKNKRI